MHYVCTTNTCLPMNKLHTYNFQKIDSYINHREGEIKFGEKVEFIHDNEPVESQLELSKANYVVFGIPENIGVRASGYNTDCSNTWEATLSALLNVQHNKFNKGRKILVLGHLDFAEEVALLGELDLATEEGMANLKKLVEKIDKEVTYWIQKIVSYNKIPIVIGGGQNNAYGIIKGCALALNKTLNAINFDAWPDLLKINGRTSCNAFSYAIKEGFLKKYLMFGVQENFIPKYVLSTIKKNKTVIRYTTFEELFIRFEKGIDFELNSAYEFLKSAPFGIEVDCKSIHNFAAEPVTMNGFSVREIRKSVSQLNKSDDVAYLHICEAAPKLDSPEEFNRVGAFISCLITDFIR